MARIELRSLAHSYARSPASEDIVDAGVDSDAVAFDWGGEVFGVDLIANRIERNPASCRDAHSLAFFGEILAGVGKRACHGGFGR